MTSHSETREIVESGYDSVADRYTALESDEARWPRMRWLASLLDLVPARSRVLDIGCGNGVPATRALAESHDVVGLDVSAEQLARARRNVAEAEFVHGDLIDVELEPGFDAIVGFYVIEHVPRELHRRALERLHSWLEPGGHLLFTVEPEEQPGVVGEWLGVPMFFSQFGASRTLAMVDDAGFEIVDHAVETQLEGGREVDYLWVLARRLRDPTG